MTGGPEYPIIDARTGEVLAMDEEDRREVSRLAAEALVAAEEAIHEARREADRARETLTALLRVGDAIPLPGGRAVTVKPGAPARRAVNRQEVQAREEDLRPLGLAPVEKVTLSFPGVSAFTTTAARAGLARLGLTPETFLLAGEPSAPRVEVILPEAHDG